MAQLAEWPETEVERNPLDPEGAAWEKDSEPTCCYLLAGDLRDGAPVQNQLSRSEGRREGRGLLTVRRI